MKAASAIQLHSTTWDADEHSGDSDLLYNLGTILMPTWAGRRV